MNKTIILSMFFPATVFATSLAAQPTYEERRAENNREAFFYYKERERLRQAASEVYGIGDLFFDLVGAYAFYLQEQRRQAEFLRMIKQKNQDALDLHNRGLSETALRKIDNAIAAYPEQYVFLFTKGAILTGLKRYKEAEQCFLTVVSKMPNHAQAYVYLGLIALGRQEESAACQYFDKACQVNSGAHEAFFFRGLCRKKQGEYYNAIRDFSRVLDLKPNYRAAFYQRAICHSRMKHYTSAMINLNQAIRYYPEDAELYNLRGEIFYSEGKLDKAMSDFNQALARQPRMIEAMCNRSIVYLARGEFHLAERDIENAIREVGETGILYFALAVINEKQGQFEDFCRNMKKACELNFEEACGLDMPECK